MKKWKILFVGVGSIAKRHIRNIYVLMKQRNEAVQIDAYRTGHGTVLPEEIRNLLTETYYDVEEIPNDYDIAFITNPTQHHLQAIQIIQPKASHFFIEKPLCTVEQLGHMHFKLKQEGVYYVASPLRYSSVIKYIKENIRPEDVLSVRCISSSYLPEWRPGTDYRKTYSAHKELGGGVSIDLIHEWDYITYLFGWPMEVKEFIRKNSKLEIDSDDTAVYIADFGRLLAEIHVDYIGRVPLRQLELFTDADSIVCDLINSKICYRRSGKEISFNQVRDGYQIDELNYFWNRIDEQKYGWDSVEHAAKVLSIAGGVWKK